MPRPPDAPRSIPLEVLDRSARWHARHAPVDIGGKEKQFASLFAEITSAKPLKGDAYRRLMRRGVRRGLPWLSKAQLLAAYEELLGTGAITPNPHVRRALQVKPIRSHSGVTVVTVLTKPYPCPGKCIFCPTDARMPKSYLHDEPGAQRAERHAFDPYAQTAARLRTLEQNGHPTDKIELLILGGTWSSYRRDYQEWFVKRCFDALNGRDAADLPQAHAWNVNATRRNVGLVVETRQDHIDTGELRWLRYLGVTKVQVGIQSLDERVLSLNERGHDVQATRAAFRLLRLAGFKIHGHWMPNLLGATPESDMADYHRIWNDPAIRPDELKIYPCMLLENSDLYAYWQRGEYRPYTEAQLVDLLARAKAATPRYARLTRIIRDIPTTNVIAGNKKANLRQLAQVELARRGQRCHCIRCREVRREAVAADTLTLQDIVYETDATIEHFLSYTTGDDRLAGFLRLSLPRRDQPHPLPELADHAIIREVHIYGPALPLGAGSEGEAQHLGLGRQLIEKATALATEASFSHLAVISAVGTRAYYARLGFRPHGLYQARRL